MSKRLLAGLALIGVIAVVIAIVLVTDGPSGQPPAAAASTGGVGATTVQRRNLVATDTESGTVSYADPQTVYNRLTGTVTWLPAVGQLIRPGQALVRVDNQPVILLDGSTPAYRSLSAADVSGPDILQLNRNLKRLGFDADAIVVDDQWQPATTVGVEQLQASLGQSETGTLSLGQVVFLPGPQLVSTVEGSVGATGAGGGGSQSTSLDPPAPHPVFVGLTTTTTPTSTTPTSTPHHSRGPGSKHSGHHPSHHRSLAALIALLRAEIAELRSSQSGPGQGASAGNSPHHSGSGSNPPHHPSSSNKSPSHSLSSPASGGGGGNPVAILQTTSNRLVVTVDLAATSQSEARRGEHVTVEMPAGNAVNGVITQVSSVAQNSNNGNNNNNGGGGGGGGGNGGGSSSTIPVTIKLLGHVGGAGLDQAAVSVNFVKAEARHVLSVPVTALVATGGNNYAVQEAAAPHRLIPVTTGLFAAGYVQISGSGIYPGLQVTDSQG